jgi:hypothetical protein
LKEPFIDMASPSSIEAARELLQSIKYQSEMDPDSPFLHETFLSTLQAYPALAKEPLISVTSTWPLPFHFLCLLSEDDVPNPPTVEMLRHVYELYPHAMTHSFFYAVVALHPNVALVSYLMQLDPTAAHTVSPDRCWPIHLLVRSHFVETELAVLLARAFPASIRTPLDGKLSVIQYAIDARELLVDDEDGLEENEETILALVAIDPEACWVDFPQNPLLPLHELLTGPVTPMLVQAVVKSWPQAVMHLNGAIVRKLRLSRAVKEILKQYYTGDDFDEEFGPVDDAAYDNSNDAGDDDDDE